MNAPCLTADIMNDDDALAMAVNELLLGSKTIRRLSKRVRRGQERLQEVVDRRAWNRYLRLEGIINDLDRTRPEVVGRFARRDR